MVFTIVFNFADAVGSRWDLEGTKKVLTYTVTLKHSAPSFREVRFSLLFIYHVIKMMFLAIFELGKSSMKVTRDDKRQKTR